MPALGLAEDVWRGMRKEQNNGVDFTTRLQRLD